MSESDGRRAGEVRPFGAEESDLADLLRGAGSRPPLPGEDLAAIESAARAAWRARYGDRGGGRGWRWAALAAAAVLALAVGVVWRASPPATVATVATIERFAGEVRLDAETGDDAPVAPGFQVAAGSRLETAADSGSAAWVALRLAGGASVRLDRESRLRLVAADRVELERGAVYVDSGAGGAAAIAVVTGAASFQEIGTQFEVRLVPEAGGATARLRVREGRVAVAVAGARAVGAAGEELRVTAGGALLRSTVSRSGPDWGWVLAAAPTFDIEGRSVREYLDWFARETGLEVELADAGALQRADRVRLHGSIAHLAVGETPEVVLPSAGLGAEQVGDRLRVVTAPAGR